MPLHVPGSLAALLSLLRPAFTAPTFETFCVLIVGFVGRVGEHTVTGMWQAARLAGIVHHSRAHDFFARARWSPDQLGLLVLDFLVAVLVEAGAPIRVALDDTLFGRSGRKVFGAFFHHDPHADGGPRTSFGNNWVVLGLVVRLPVLERAVCLPVLFRLYRPSRAGQPRPSRAELGRELLDLVLARFWQRRVELLADAAYATRAFRGPPEQVTLTMRLRRDAALYADRWAIEVSFQEAKHVLGVGQARNRTERAVLRTVPFGFLSQTITIVWYALCGQAERDVRRRRRTAPWYRQKRQPSFQDMLVALRREIVRAQYQQGPPRQRTRPEFTHPALHSAGLAA